MPCRLFIPPSPTTSIVGCTCLLSVSVTVDAESIGLIRCFRIVFASVVSHLLALLLERLHGTDYAGNFVAHGNLTVP